MACEELLAWAAGRSAWQQDALRRLAEQGELTQDDLSALRRQILAAEGLPVDEPPRAVPLAPDHLSEAASNAPKTVLASLGPVRHVDRLEPDQPPMRFAVNGITLIYGPNASGKSGYCRIMKQLCRSLSPARLRGNVYDAAEAPAAEVGLAFRVGGDDDPKTELTWMAGNVPPAELGRISVFDTAAARIYVDKERKIEFLPYELDLLNKLALSARALEAMFRVRQEELDASISVPLPAGYTDGTAAARMIAKLVPDTPLADLPSEQELRALAEWSDDDQAELDKLIEDAGRDPQTIARRLDEARRALQSVKDDVAAAEAGLGDAAIEALSRKQQDAAAKNAAAEASAHDLFRDEPIPDVGSEVWRQMLRHAREFAAQVFPDQPPPQIATARQCVLCQQELDVAAATRLAAFDRYLGQRAAEEAAAATRDFEDAVAAMRRLSVRTKANVAALLAGYAALSEESKANADAIAAYFEAAGTRLQAVRRILDEGAFNALGILDALPASPASLIEQEIALLATEIDRLNRLEHDEEAARQQAQRQAELTDRRKLGEQIELIVARRNDLEERHRVAACRAQCRPTAITQQITRRRRDILTPSLKEALDNELRALRLTHIPLALSDRGDQGDSIVEVALSAQQRIANNSEVLSEGEQRGLALACFMAELNEIGRDHGIIVDDPVSSLDHSRIEAVALRLAAEAAKGRQVIVFTHNVVFHYAVDTAARKAGIACQQVWISSLGNDRFGIIDDAQKPWQMKPVTERLHEISQARQGLEKSGYDLADESFRDRVNELYGKMRTTWERIVEEILFNKVIQRFRPEVMTQSLKAASFDPEQDYPVIFEGMKRTSHYSGHDRAEDLTSDLPALEEIDRDIGELKSFADHARERRKALDKSLKGYDKGIEPVLL